MSGRPGWLVLGGMIIVAGVLRLFVISRVKVVDTGMEPIIPKDSTHWLYKLAYSDVSEVARGDIVSVDARVLGAPYDSLVWRIVALPGDTVEIAPGRPVAVNGKSLLPPVIPDSRVVEALSEWSVPAGHVFTMGVGCCSQWDSYGLGPVPMSAIRGRVLH